MNAELPLIQRLIVLVKQHRKPSSDKSITVLMKVMDAQLLDAGKISRGKLIDELEQALASDKTWSTSIRQQHSEEELRGCFANLLQVLKST